MTEKELQKEFIRTAADELGFDACGFATLDHLPLSVGYMRHWLDEEYSASMVYMRNNLSIRLDPRQLLPEAKTMIMVLMNYYPAQWQPIGQPRIASYAYGDDYHYVVRKRLTLLAEKISASRFGKGHSYRVFADSAPVMERFWAQRAGLGWIGKSGMLVNQRLGTYTFIGTLITSLQFDSDTPQPNRCGRCHACLDACPTAAIVADGQIDARRCLSYLTIEHKGDIPPEFVAPAGDRLYGCDRCMSVCPWNRFAKPNDIEEFNPTEGLFEMDWQVFSRSDYNRVLKSSAMQRAGYRKLKNRVEQILSRNE